MRDFHIYPEKDMPDDDGSKGFEQFKKEIEDRINSNENLLEQAKECNRRFTEGLRKILSDSENDLYTGAMVPALQAKTPRYSYIKNLEFDGREYEAEIDNLERTFRLSC